MSRRLTAWITLLATVAFYIAALAVTFVCTTDWTARQTAAVVLTGLVVIWYTWETMLLRQTAHAQRENQLRPFVVFHGTSDGYSLENIGNATALDVRVKPVSITGEGIAMHITFPSAIPFLKAGGTAGVTADVTLNGRKIDGVFAAHLDPNYAVQDIDLHVTFRSIEAKRYELVQTVAPRTMEVKGYRDPDAL